MAKCNEKVKQMFARLQKKLLVSALITASISSSMSLAVSAQVNTPQQANTVQQASITSMTSFNDNTLLNDSNTTNNVSASSIKAEAMDEYWDYKFNDKYDEIWVIIEETQKGMSINLSSLSSLRCHLIEKTTSRAYVMDSEALGKISIASRYVINIAAEQKKQEELEKKRQEEAAFDALDRSEGSSFWTHKWVPFKDYDRTCKSKFISYDKYLNNETIVPRTTEEYFYRPICKLSEIKNRSDASKFNLNIDKLSIAV